MFYNFFSECLGVDENDQVTLTFSLNRLSDEVQKYDRIFLKLNDYKWIQDHMKIDYFFPDILERTGFNECNFDFLFYPFFKDPQNVHPRILYIPDD